MGRMQWCSGKNAWTWESKQRTNANHCGVAEQIFINVPSAGIHTISFSMREDGFEMDKCGNTRPGANLANGDYYLEAPTGGARIKNTTGAAVSISTGSGNDAKWTITKISGSNYTIKNVQTNRFLEVPYGACNAGDKTQNPNVNLGTYTEAVADHLKWNITKVGDNYFLEPLHCNKVVDRNNGNTMHLWPYAAGNAILLWH